MTDTIEYLTTSQAARRAGVDTSTIRRWADAGELESSRTGPGGHRRIRTDALDAVLRPATVDLDQAAPPERSIPRWEQVTGGWGGWKPTEKISTDRLAEIRAQARSLIRDLETVVSTITNELSHRDGE